MCPVPKKVVIKDSTLREGLDVPGVNFSLEQKLKIASLLDQAQVPEMEVVAPGNVFKDLEFVKRVREERIQIKTSGLIYAHHPQSREEIQEASKVLHRFDLLMPVSTKRKPYEKNMKVSHLLEVLGFSLGQLPETGVGFPNSTQVEIDFLLEISEKSVRSGARRITIYDTNGKSDPFEIYQLMKQLKDNLKIPLFFHGHNDLGMATSNSLAAIDAGAEGLDVTVNGLGDRAGNASLEQIVLNLYLRGFDTGIPLQNLRSLSKAIEWESGIEVSKLAPIVGEYIFHHSCPR
jgi:isopropylmalate/homocitrate/citramalate synthase